MSASTEPPGTRDGLEALVDTAFREHRGMLFGLVYRMTGSTADAEELVQECYVRALERPPPRLDLPLRPWLVRVAANLARDRLRRRRRQDYPGDWLPAPLPDDGSGGAGVAAEHAQAGGEDAEVRYGRLESVTQAFLVALEALTPTQRAVLLLREVYGLSGRDCAATLEMSEINVKVTLHRARAALLDYDGTPCRPTPSLVGQVQEVLGRFLQAVVSRDEEAIRSVLSEDARLVSDAGGEFLANVKPLRGPVAIARFYARAELGAEGAPFVAVVNLNGLPALVADVGERGPRLASRFVLSVELDTDGKIRMLRTVLATPKLAAIRFAAEAASD